MFLILKIAIKYKLYVIEDAAEVLGLKYKKKQCGSFGDISILSFYANKHITTGEGGMLLTNNPSLNKKFKDYRNLCFGSPSCHRPQYNPPLSPLALTPRTQVPYS